jgi:adhesin/invasin
MLPRTLTLLFFIWVSILLTGCLGGGGGNNSESGTISELTDNRVSTVTLLVTDNFQRANGQSFIILTIIARDNTNAPLPDVEVSLASPSDFAVFITPTGVTEENGRFTTGVVSSQAETFEVTATAGGMRSKPVSVTFIAPVELIELKAEEEVLAVGESTTVTVIISEELTAGEPLPNAPFKVTVSGSAKLSDVPAITDINGQATFTVTNDIAETVTVTVTSGKLIQRLKLYFGATLNLQPESINALDTATLITLLKDSNNAPIAVQEVKFNFVGENNETLTPISTTTRENGTAQVTITDLAKDGGIAVVQASSGSLTAQATVRFGELLVDPRIAKVSLIVIDDFQPANGRDKITITIMARDATNAPVANVPVSLRSHSDTAFFEAWSGITEENGRFTTTMTNSLAETVEIKATAGGVAAPPVISTFIDNTVDPRVNKVNVVVTNDSQAANGRDEITLTVIVRDDKNAPLSEVPINLVSDSDYALFNALSGTTGENGRFSTTITSSFPETFEVIATAGGKNAAPVNVTFAAPVGEVVLRASDTVLSVDESSTITVTILRKVELEEVLGDFSQFFNRVTLSGSVLDELLQQDILLPNTPFKVTTNGDTELQDVPDRTNENGQASFTVTNNNREVVEIVVSSGAITRTLRLYFGATLSLQPNSINALDTATLTTLLKDGNNAPIADQEVKFNFVGENNETLTPISTTTRENGTALVTITDLAKDGGEARVQVSSGSLTAQATVRFGEVLVDPRISKVSLIVSDDPQPASGRDQITLTVIARDAANAPVTNIPVSLISDSDTAFFEAWSGTTGENGRFTTTVTNSVAESLEIRAIAGGVPASSVTVTFFSSTVDTRISTVKAIISDNFQPADGEKKITLTVIARDADNAPVSNVAINIVSNSDTAFFDVLSGTTEENGRFSTTITNSVAENVEVRATGGGVSAEPVTLNFIDSTIDSRVNKVNVVVTNDSVSANGRDEITLTVIVRDDNNAPISEVPINLVSDSDHALFEALSGTTGKNGRFSTTITSSFPETFEVIATAGGKEAEPVSVTFAASVGEMVLRASPTILQTGESSTLTITILRKVELEELLEDFSKFFNNVSLGGSVLDEMLQKDVLLPNTPFKVAVSGNAVLGEVPERTNATGQASFTVSNNHKETTDITITSGAITRTLRLYFGASLNLLPNLVNAIGTANLTALLKDGNQAPIAEQEVKFNFVGENNETLTPNTATTAIDGTAIVTITDIENNGGIATVNVNSGALNTQATVNFLAEFGENRLLEVKTTATVLDMNQSATITTYITDQNDLPLIGQKVSFSTRTDGGDSQAQVSPKTGFSDVEGEIKTIVSNTKGENVIVVVRADSAKQEIPLYFGAKLSLSPTEAVGFADDTTPVTLTAIVSDAQGTGIAGIPVNIRIISGRAFLDNFRSNTNELGRSTVNVTSDSVGEVVIELQADNLPEANATLTFRPTGASLLIVSTDADSLSLNGETTITADVKDAQGNPVKDGIQVIFTTSVGEITGSALTNNGFAKATFSATTQAGLATITATAGEATDSLTLTVQSSSAGTIEVSKVEPEVIGIIGSGVAQSTTLEFLVKDNLGNPVADGTLVAFSLGKTTLGGGETITTQGEGGITATGTTNNGLVSVTLKSGAVAGTVDVIATVNDTISTVARVIIAGGIPDAAHLSFAAEFLNIAGGVTFGLLDTITVIVGDRFGNIVPDGTSVSFITEGGTIGKSIGGGTFTSTTEFGQATAILQSANPTTPALGGVPTLRKEGYECSGDYAAVFSAVAEPLCGNPGLVTIVIFTTGSESFVDSNGNGYYDSGEPFDDLSEPYIDGNDNFTFDNDELYIDVNGNGNFDDRNNQFDGPGGESENTTIWHSRRVLFSDITNQFKATPTSFSIPNGGSETFIVENISDIYGNALVEGTKFQVTTNNGVLGGTTNFELVDSNGRGRLQEIFTLSSNPCSETGCPKPASATITISITSSFDGSPGGNGNVRIVIEGGINQ